jgi:hypothetical protein
MTDLTSSPNPQPLSGPRFRYWLWFVAGFLIVLIGMSFLSRDFYDGRAVHRTFVWRYYILEVQRAWNSTGNLGPTSGSSAHAVKIALQHVLFSAVGGAIMVFIGWIIRRLSLKR